MIKESKLIHVTIKYNPDRRDLKIYYNGRLYAGMIGRIAEMRYKAISAEIDRLNNMLNRVKKYSDGHKTQTEKI